MEDIAPKLYEKLKSDFDVRTRRSSELRRLRNVLKSGKARYPEAHEYAKEIGRILGSVFQDDIKADELPGRMLYFNIGERTVKPLLEQALNLVLDYSTAVQQDLNQKAGIGIKAIRPKLNEDRISGLIGRLSNGR